MFPWDVTVRCGIGLMTETTRTGRRGTAKAARNANHTVAAAPMRSGCLFIARSLDRRGLQVRPPSGTTPPLLKLSIVFWPPRGRKERAATGTCKTASGTPISGVGATCSRAFCAPLCLLHQFVSTLVLVDVPDVTRGLDARSSARLTNLDVVEPQVRVESALCGRLPSSRRSGAAIVACEGEEVRLTSLNLASVKYFRHRAGHVFGAAVDVGSRLSDVAHLQSLAGGRHDLHHPDGPTWLFRVLVQPATSWNPWAARHERSKLYCFPYSPNIASVCSNRFRSSVPVES